MKTHYALIFACLALQACGQSESPTVSTNINEYSTASEYALPIVGDEDYTAAIPALQSNGGAEFEGTSRDDAATPWSASPALRDEIDSWNGDDHFTGAVTVPGSVPGEEDVWAEFWFGDTDVTGAVSANKSSENDAWVEFWFGDTEVTGGVSANNSTENDTWVEFWFGGNAAEAP